MTDIPATPAQTLSSTDCGPQGDPRFAAHQAAPQPPQAPAQPYPGQPPTYRPPSPQAIPAAFPNTFSAATPAGYPVPQAPTFPANAKTNGMAIAALICGLAGFLILPACAAMGLGFGALGTVKRTGQPGRGIAVAGIATSGIWLALWIVLFIVA
jgi:hypothetical protein